jgi:ribonuclease-3
VAQELGLGRQLVERAPAQAEDELERLARNRNVLAAVIEAALGALFLQHGFAAIEDAVVAAFSRQIEDALTTRVDHKTDLQEVLARGGRHVTYVEVSVKGPPHERHFTCAALVDGDELGRGEGQTKKAAEQEAAREALARLENGDS